MSKRERVGTIVVLSIMALIMAVTIVLRYCEPSSPVDEQVDAIEQFEVQADSAAAATATVKHKSTKTSKTKSAKKSRQRASKKERQQREPRPIDPVPRF